MNIINPYFSSNSVDAGKNHSTSRPAANSGAFLEAVKNAGFGFLAPVSKNAGKDKSDIKRHKQEKGSYSKTDTVFDLIGRVESAERKNGFLER
ncbi:MAG: hypothetical protein NTZ10_03785 [Candidatus Saganbacteria bacterium]|nr:hypothetical protein [Candidatus Saganbacteria bacterium]